VGRELAVEENYEPVLELGLRREVRRLAGPLSAAVTAINSLRMDLV
jgi:hypothetical protein